ncbi:hypothetical protein CC80DRAFT_496852 [Byssothecium circinans]|uniref:Uncharacterized protein n=1 Tax=Byssothecium circinans TaxID=147558 RepID=A0A6A5TNA6_9PLEO|nr:hypothetical protein CC80DRAFT_496852 [Byssothecium circinans]
MTIPLVHTQPTQPEPDAMESPISIPTDFSKELWHSVLDRTGHKTDLFLQMPEPWNQSEAIHARQPASQEMVLAALFANALANAKAEHHSHRSPHKCNEHEDDTDQNCTTIATNIPTLACPKSFSLALDNCTKTSATVYETGWGWNFDGKTI